MSFAPRAVVDRRSTQRRAWRGQAGAARCQNRPKPLHPVQGHEAPRTRLSARPPAASAASCMCRPALALCRFHSSHEERIDR